MTSIGIHQVAVAHQKIVKPRTNGRICTSTGECGAAATSIAPARVEIAAAPMLIQYGGARSDGLIVKNV